MDICTASQPPMLVNTTRQFNSNPCRLLTAILSNPQVVRYSLVGPAHSASRQVVLYAGLPNDNVLIQFQQRAVYCYRQAASRWRSMDKKGTHCD